MKSFLSNLSKIVGMLSERGGVDEEDVEKLVENYNILNVCEQQRLLELLLDVSEGDYGIYVYILSFLLSNVKDEKIIQIINNILLDQKLSFFESLNISFQLKHTVFKNSIKQNQGCWNDIRTNIHKKYIELVKEKLLLSLEYIPYKERKKRVVLVIEPLLGVKHAPSKIVYDTVVWLSQLGYEVIIVSSNMYKIQREQAIDWWDGVTSSYLFTNTVCYEVEYNEYRVPIYYFVFDNKTYFAEMERAVKLIYDFNPQYVWMFGDECILADLCNQFTTVVTTACSRNMPVTVAPVIASYFEHTEQEIEENNKMLNEKQVMIEYKPGEIVEKPGDTFIRKDFGIPEDSFVIVIAGNRLDYEVTKDVQETLEKIIIENDNIIIEVIWVCPKLRKTLEEGMYRKRYIFLGYQDNFEQAIGLGNIFLNPPRQGGGGGAYHACRMEVPVVTLRHCDCANVGEEFVCDSLEKMPQLVKRYIHDKEFMDEQKKICKIKASKWENTNSVKEIEKVCDFVQKINEK